MITLDEIYELVSLKTGIGVKFVEEANRIQYEFIVETMKNCENDINIIHIGKIVKKKPRKVYEYKKYREGISESNKE